MGCALARLQILLQADENTDVPLARLRTMLDTTEFANAVARGEALSEPEAVEAGLRIVAGGDRRPGACHVQYRMRARGSRVAMRSSKNVRSSRITSLR